MLCIGQQGNLKVIFSLILARKRAFLVVPVGFFVGDAREKPHWNNSKRAVGATYK